MLPARSSRSSVRLNPAKKSRQRQAHKSLFALVYVSLWPQRVSRLDEYQRRAASRECFAASRAPIPRIVFRIHVFKAEWSNRSHLRDVLAGFCPVEVPGIAGEHDNAARRICIDLVAVESIAQA